ncbi:MAG TPA: aldo/keto reductase [Cytophagales bacterium]|nr:aldo/keto reductase [Cytophagales bacterium]
MKYKLLGPSGLKVSELCLGTMGFGTEWNWGADQATSYKIMETFVNAGGNFLDTANRYTEGSSERIIGEYVKGNRDHFVIATKYSLHDNLSSLNASGNSRKNMFRSVHESLKRLQTEYIDVLYLHIWDFLTPIDEVMRGFQDLVTQGKVNYVAISDTPAWIVSSAQTMAQCLGWNKLVALQVEYSLIQRTPERELIPMAQHYGMTLTPWAPLAGGALTGKYLKGDKGRIPDQSKRLNERSVGITKVVMEVAEELGVAPAHVALKWTMQKPFSSIPIVGATKVNQLEENLKAVDLTLSAEQISRLDEASKIEMGFPHEFFQEAGVRQTTYGGFYDHIQKR